jgi:hypothetical protein
MKVNGVPGPGKSPKQTVLGPPEKLVLGYLAENGPTRTVEVLGHVSAEADDTPLSSIARALEDLIEAGTLEARDGDVVSVSGDPRS